MNYHWKYCKFWHRVYMGAWNNVHTLPAQYRMKAHCPGLKGAPGTWIHLHMFSKCHSSEGKTLKKKNFRHQFSHRDQWEKVYKLTESLKNVIHILGNVNQSLEPYWTQTIVRLMHSARIKHALGMNRNKRNGYNWWSMYKRWILSGSKWSVWRGLILKQILENERTVKPLTNNRLNFIVMFCFKTTLKATVLENFFLCTRRKPQITNLPEGWAFWIRYHLKYYKIRDLYGNSFTLITFKT